MGKHAIFLGVIFVGSCICVWRVRSLMLARPQRIVLTFEPVFSHSFQAAFRDYCAHADASFFEDVERMSEEVCQKYSLIKSVAFERVPPNILRLQIAAYQPVCLLPGSLVLLENGAICAVSECAKKLVHDMSEIHINTDGRQKEELKALVPGLRQLPRELFAAYDVHINFPAGVRCILKQQPRFALQAHLGKVLDPAVIVYVASIYEQLNQRGIFKRRDGRQWVADVRFANQVVVRSEQGGKQ